MKPLKELSRIDFGCYDSALSKGEILYLQLKNFDENNQFLANVDAFVEEDEKYNKNLLLENDILLPSKGTRIFATLFRAQWGKAVQLYCLLIWLLFSIYHSTNNNYGKWEEVVIFFH